MVHVQLIYLFGTVALAPAPLSSQFLALASILLVPYLGPFFLPFLLQGVSGEVLSTTKFLF